MKHKICRSINFCLKTNHTLVCNRSVEDELTAGLQALSLASPECSWCEENPGVLACPCCEEYFCKGCAIDRLAKCENCQKYVCYDCMGFCAECNGAICPDCEDIIECETCGDALHEDCGLLCDLECGAWCCSSCINVCADCGTNFCSTCGTEECDDCSEPVCESCWFDHVCDQEN